MLSVRRRPAIIAVFLFQKTLVLSIATHILDNKNSHPVQFSYKNQPKQPYLAKKS